LQLLIRAQKARGQFECTRMTNEPSLMENAPYFGDTGPRDNRHTHRARGSAARCFTNEEERDGFQKQNQHGQPD
jgi:hypothetical protein